MLFIAGGLFLALVAADLLDLTSRKPKGLAEHASSLGGVASRTKLG